MWLTRVIGDIENYYLHIYKLMGPDESYHINYIIFESNKTYVINLGYAYDSNTERIR